MIIKVLNMSIITNQVVIKKQFAELVEKLSDTELPNILKQDQVDEIQQVKDVLLLTTTTSRRHGKYYMVGDYILQFSNKNDTIVDILKNIGVTNTHIEVLSKLTVKVNNQLHTSKGHIHWFSKKDSSNYNKIKTIKLEQDTLILLPLAVPDPYIENDTDTQKRPSIPPSIRNKVWDRDFNNLDRGNCYVCNKRVYNNIKNGWHCAHNIPYITCGTHLVCNLKVSCPTCNLQCGTLVLDVFKYSRSC